MKKFTLVVAVGVAVAFLAACSSKASKEDCTAACKKIGELQKAAMVAPKVDDATAKATEELDNKIKELQAQVVKAAEDLDKELAVKLTEKTKKPVDKNALEADYKAKKEEAAKANAKAIQDITAQKAQIAKNAADAKAKAEADAAKMAEDAVNACVDTCIKSGFKKKYTDCQKNAAKFEDIANCASSNK